LPEAYNLGDIRLIQERISTSAADALVVNSATCPEGKIWTITAFGYRPSANEARLISFQKVTKSGNAVAVFNPLSMTLNPAWATFIEQGLIYQLFPGEYIVCRRDVATAGSTMTCLMQLVESDLPLYTYEEPQIIKRQARAISSMRSRIAGSISRRGGGGEAPGALERGGRGFKA
jgi:hypothetical protein